MLDRWHFFRDTSFVALMMMLLFSCHRHEGSLMGRWTVEKITLEFDEKTSTPEMVRQYGELEKGNTVEIDADSLITFISCGDTLRGRCSLQGTQIFIDGRSFGCYENGFIQTETLTPMGKVIVRYVQ